MPNKLHISVCISPPAPENGYIINHMDVHENESIIMYGCDDGFTIENGEQQCLNGQWLNDNPQCTSSKYINQNEIECLSF